MSDRPILFSAPMIRAILDGSKTQTRRVVPQAVQDAYYDYDDWCRNVSAGVPSTRQFEQEFFRERARYAPGDRLWVRETFHEAGDRGTHYQADWSPAELAKPMGPRWRPSIFMPRALSRITLDVTAVKVERLNSISPDDAVAEGAPCHVCGGEFPSEDDCHCFHRDKPARIDFEALWDSINGKRPGCAWADNPWVVAISFTRIPTTERTATDD